MQFFSIKLSYNDIMLTIDLKDIHFTFPLKYFFFKLKYIMPRKFSISVKECLLHLQYQRKLS